MSSSTLLPQIQTAKLFEYQIHLVDIPKALAFVEERLQSHQNTQVVTLNPEMIMAGEQNPGFGTVLKQADLALPDGAGLVWALRRAKYQVSRLPGIEFSEAILQWAAQQGEPIALVGATPEVLALCVKNLKERFAGLNIVFAHHGFFSSEEAEAIANACAATQPKLVLVALGVPRQELWVAQYKQLFQGTVLVGVGGSFDVWSGKTLRAPEWMRKLNLEWLYRITSEPWRIQRTYKPLPMFVVKVLMSKA